MKLRKLHIDDYKMFKDFDISFVDENDEALPIIVLAGVNGSGKTSLLEYLISPPPNNRYAEIEVIDKNEKLFTFFMDSVITFYQDEIIYLSAGSDKIENIKETIRQKYIDRAFEIDKPSKALNELQNFIKNVFDGLNLTFNLSVIKYNENEVLFKDNNGVKFDIDELSTGEKTLLSKILYLYFKDYKDKVILIDEPELSLHPSWQNKVLKIYENFAIKNNCQIIIATHSPHIIGSAKPEYIRLLKKEDNKIVAIDNIDRSYGLEFDKILTDIMGVENLRTPAVAKDIRRLWELLEDEEYESQEYKELYQKLEDILGSLDKDMVLARLEIARIKSRNAKTK